MPDVAGVGGCDGSGGRFRAARRRPDDVCRQGPLTSGTVTNGFDPRAELAHVHDAPGAWSFIRGFTSRWSQQALSQGDSCDEAEIRSAEQRLGITLPQTLRDGYLLCGRHEYHLENPGAYVRPLDRLLRPDELRLDEERTSVIYRVGPEFLVEWAACLTGEPDPPVVYRKPGSSAGWQDFLPSVSWAWVEMVVADALFSDDLGNDRELEHGDMARLEQGFSRLAIPDYPSWWTPPGGITRWFGGPDVILREEAGIWLWARCRTAAALPEMRAAMPGDWWKLGH